MEDKDEFGINDESSSLSEKYKSLQRQRVIPQFEHSENFKEKYKPSIN